MLKQYICLNMGSKLRELQIQISSMDKMPEGTEKNRCVFIAYKFNLYKFFFVFY